MSLKHELPLWRDISERLDRLHEAKKMKKSGQACPFCGRAVARSAGPETMKGSNEGLKSGFFTCASCSGTWFRPLEGQTE